MSKMSPFFVIEDFLSPLQCERILKLNQVKNVGSNIRHLNEGHIPVVKNSITDYFDQFQNRYGVEVSDDVKLLFYQFDENASKPALSPQIDGWEMQRRKWIKTKNIDLIGFIPLKSYCDSLPIDLDFEVYGGKLELLNFNFSILPERGSLILMPAAPNFIYALSPINFGSFEMIKVHCAFTTKHEFILDNFSTLIQDII